MGLWNGGLEPEDRPAFTERSENISMGGRAEKASNPILDLGALRARELGLRLQTAPIRAYCADDIHQLLGKGEELYGWNDARSDWMRTLNPLGYKHSHAGLLIGSREIVQESEERQALRKVIDLFEDNQKTPRTMVYGCIQWDELIRELKALLEKGGGK